MIKKIVYNDFTTPKSLTRNNAGCSIRIGSLNGAGKPEDTVHGLKHSFLLVVTSFVVMVLLSMSPVQAQNLGLSVDQLIERLGSAAETADQPLEFREPGCIENEKPGSPDQKIVSCTHMLGSGRLLITNSEPDGPLLDIATQPWDGSENGTGAMMITWITAAINGGEPSEYGPAANALVSAATSGGDGNATMGKVGFFVLDLGGKLTITAMAQ